MTDPPGALESSRVGLMQGEVDVREPGKQGFGRGSKPMVPFWVGAPPILVYFSGDWDVHWYDLGFDPWPDGSFLVGRVPLLK